MRMRRLKSVATTLLILCLASAAAPASAQEHQKQQKHKPKQSTVDLPAVLWRDPGDISARNLFYGAGGREDAPDPRGTFIFDKEDMEGTSPKFNVKDTNGVEWRVKLGAEPQCETAATRLLWAAGYFVDEDYYLPELRVEGLPKLRRGRKFVTEGAIVHGARLKRKTDGIKKIGNWDWFQSPFVGSKELNGLRVMMVLMNNWDLKEINNAVYVVDGEQRYVVSDLGASFGKTGNTVTRSKGDLKAYKESKFVKKTTPEEVDFELHSRPFFLTAINISNYRKRTKMEKLGKHIPRSQAKWVGWLLSQLSDEQIRDCFRSAGYLPEEVDGYTEVVKKRIAALNAL
jgi:hypothetical protein